MSGALIGGQLPHAVCRGNQCRRDTNLPASCWTEPIGLGAPPSEISGIASNDVAVRRVVQSVIGVEAVRVNVLEVPLLEGPEDHKALGIRLR